MAGAGFKDFSVGEVLTASDVDTYLMQQTVMNFADSAARGSALGTATGTAVPLAEGMVSYLADVDGYLMQQTVMNFADSAARGSALGTATGTAVPLAEGMVSYLADVDAVQVYDGSDWVAVGGLVSSSYATMTDAFATTGTAFATVTGLSVSHTCSDASHDVLVVAMLGAFGGNNVAANQFLNLMAGTAVILEGGSASVSNSLAGFYTGTSQEYSPVTLVAKHSPASTSAITYSVEVSTSGGNLYVNRRHTDTFRTASSLLVLEVRS